MTPRWTAEQLENAERYGVCFVCRAPLELGRREVLNKTGLARRNGEPEFVFELSIVCPNGHATRVDVEFPR